MKPLGITSHRALPTLIACAFFMENLDATIIVTAMPQMAASFGVHPVDINVGISAYILTLMMFVPASGSLANRFGTRNVFAAAVIIFTLASVLCAISTSLIGFTLARVLQGFGAAMMVPVGQLAVLHNTEKPDLIRAISTITWPALIAPILGPPIGGFITTYASWHWIFLLNVPLGAIGLILSWQLIDQEKTFEHDSFDFKGFFLSAAACFTLMLGLEAINNERFSYYVPMLSILASLVLIALVIQHVNRHPAPLFELWALRIKSYAVTLIGGSMFRMAISAIPFLLPLLFQVGFGMSAFDAGMLMLAVFAGNLVMKPFTPRLLYRFRFRPLLLINGISNALLILSCAFITPATPLPVILLVLFAGGVTRSLQFAALNTLAFAEIPIERMTGANTLFNMSQQMASGLGIAIAALALRIADMLTPAGGESIPLHHFHLAFIIVGSVALLGALDTLTLTPHAGDRIRRRRNSAMFAPFPAAENEDRHP